MRRQLVTGLLMTIALTVLLGLIYPLAVTAVSQVAFSRQANGSFVKDKAGHVVGSSLIGQPFVDSKGNALPRYFQPRPSAAGDGYNANYSGASNLGPSNPTLLATARSRADAFRAFNGLPKDADVPVDAVTASGSGLDPHISPANAALQARRVARARHLTLARVIAVVRRHTSDRVLGFIGEPVVNVLDVNLDLDKMGESRVACGQLRVYLGAAPGVGKTFAMLNEGRRRASRGTDVVVGYVETHGRANTAAQVGELEVVPRRRIEYRGATFEEMDVDALIARRPAWVLVDELAHTNVPGSRNEKRWQDVEAVLDAGINVISTVNVQHLESLHDVVEQITGIDQQETVPDQIVRAADQVELIDQTPEALRRRMAHGNIYAPEKVDAALGNYFRVGNLTALRELALLWLADKVDASLQDYRERHDIGTTWETKERVVVALTGAPGGDDLIRRAARMARRTHGELIGVHVVRSDGLRGGRTGDAETIAERVSLLEEVGGRYVEVVGTDVADALLHVATAENATQIVLGASRESRLTELWRGSVVRKLLRNARGRLDVHVISSPNIEEDLARPSRPFTLLPRYVSVSRKRRLTGFVLTVVGLPLLTLALVPARHSLGFQNAILCYLLAVVLVAVVGGVMPALVASVLGFLLLNYFFAPPIHTFTISNGRDVLALVAFLVIGGVVSVLVDLAAGRRAEAYQARSEARMLATMAGITVDDPDPLPRLLEQIGDTFGLDEVRVLARGGEGDWYVEAKAACAPPDEVEPTPLRSTDNRVFDPDFGVALDSDAYLAWSGRSLTAEEREVLASFTTQIALARHRRALQREAEQAIAQARANELRNALLAAVSHDLRTPLASIRAAATSLLATDVDWPPEARDELLHTIDDEAARLNDLVGNLLDMSRLRSGEVVTRAQLVDVEEIVGAALASLSPPADAVVVDVADGLPLMTVDPALLERVLANLIANALRWTPPDVPVRVEVAALGNEMHIRIVDRGPGIPVSERERVVLPFQRLGDQPAGLGVGLGLAVAKGFIEAMGGELRIEDTPGGGATMVVVVPIESDTDEPPDAPPPIPDVDESPAAPTVSERNGART